ncbi:LOW QUALITY PROTEIN: olfactory receptor 51Q1-like [Morus bassanus]
MLCDYLIQFGSRNKLEEYEFQPSKSTIWDFSGGVPSPGHWESNSTVLRFPDVVQACERDISDAEHVACEDAGLQCRCSLVHHVVDNSSHPSCYTFIPAGIPGLEVSHIWLSIPFTCTYIVSLAGNCTTLFVVRTDLSLCKPMYQFLSMLAITSLGLSPTPTVRNVFWVNYREISFGACFAQLYFVHAFSFMESSVLLAMAFDGYVAICYLLRYSSILTSARVAKIRLAAQCSCLLEVLPSLLLLRSLPFCQSHVLSHTYCLHRDLIPVCADIIFNSLYGLAVVILLVVLNPLLNFLSYIMICKTIASITSQRECLKALNNCLSHILAVLIPYIPMIHRSMVHHFGKHPPLSFVSSWLFPAMLNPTIYSIKTKQICRGILKVLMPRKSFSPWHHST